MRQGFVKVAAVTPDIRVADVEYNTKQICAALDEAAQQRSHQRSGLPTQDIMQK